MVEQEPKVNLNELGVAVGVLGHPVALRIIAFLNDHPLSATQGTEEKKDASREKPPLEEVPTNK